MKQAQGQGKIGFFSSGAGGAHLGWRGRPTILMGPNDDKGGGGAGGDDKGGGTPALTDEAKAEVNKMVNEAVSGAVTAHMGRFKKQFTEDMTKAFGEQLGPIGETLKTLTEAQAKGGKGKGGGSNEGPSDEVKEMLARYEGRIKELEGQNKAERDAREQEKQTRLREEERGQLATVLREKGLPEVMVKSALALLHTEEKRVARTEDGRIVFKIEKGTGAGRYTDELDLATGADEWLKSEEGKSFVPARPAQGGGGQAARGTQGGAGGDKKAVATQDLARILLGGGQ